MDVSQVRIAKRQFEQDAAKALQPIFDDFEKKTGCRIESIQIAITDGQTHLAARTGGVITPPRKVNISAQLERLQIREDSDQAYSLSEHGVALRSEHDHRTGKALSSLVCSHQLRTAPALVLLNRVCPRLGISIHEQGFPRIC
jgi:hypothetical protein